MIRGVDIITAVPESAVFCASGAVVAIFVGIKCKIARANLSYIKYHGQLIGRGNAEVVKHIGNKQRYNNKGNTYRHSAQNYSAYGKAASAGLVYLTENAYYKPGDCTKEE